MAISEIIKLDSREIDTHPGEILCFIAIKDEVQRVPHFLDHYRSLGVDRFFFVDNGSTDGSRELLLQQDDCHCFHTDGAYFVENVEPPAWTNTLANAFGHGHWCLTVDVDELLVFPHWETVGLLELCAHMDANDHRALYCAMIDMYPDGPLTGSAYRPGQPFVEACPYLDPQPGWIWPRDGECPPRQMFGGVRERVFWKGAKRRETPPCISKVPLVRWEKGMKYLFSMHSHSGAELSDLTGNLLHFKFLEGFLEANAKSVSSNVGVVEKGLEERKAYSRTLDENPELTLMYPGSVRYRDSRQLMDLGWMQSTQGFDAFAAQVSAARHAATAMPVHFANKETV